MTQLLLNTIIAQGDQLTQWDFLKQVRDLELEIDGIEVRHELFDTDEVLREDEQTKVKKLAINQHWTVFYTIPYDLFVQEGFNPHLKRWMSEGHFLGARNLKLNLGDLAGISQVNGDKLREWCQDYQMTLTIENGQTQANGSIASLRQALDLIRDHDLPVGFTFDLGNWTVVGEDSWQAFQNFKDEITTFHIKNVDAQGQPTLVQDGIHAWEDFMGLDIPYIVEYPIDMKHLAQQVDLIQQVLKR